MKIKKAIILSGGTGSRLFPLTKVLSKQILPVYDKPMIYYPLSTMMLIGIKEFLIISSNQHITFFKNLLGNGKNLGLKIKYKSQKKPEGIAQAITLGKSFIGKDDFALILGDNILFGGNIKETLKSVEKNSVSTVVIQPVENPEAYGVIKLNSQNKPIKIIEKPKKYVSNLAVIGLYFYKNKAIEYVSKLGKSLRGELEITDLNNIFIKKNSLTTIKLGRSVSWFDAGNANSLHDVSSLIKGFQERTGEIISSPEEISLRNGWITKAKLKKLIKKKLNSKYYLKLDYLINHF